MAEWLDGTLDGQMHERKVRQMDDRWVDRQMSRQMGD